MTDPTGPQDDSAVPHDDSTPTVPPVPLTPPAYDAAPYVAPTAPSYETTPYGAAPAGPAYTPSPYGAAPGAPYPGAGYPVQTTPGAPPVMPYGYGGYAPARKTNGLAIAAMVLSILGFVWILPFVGSLAGAIMGHVSLGQITRSGEGGRGIALAGVIVGWAGLALLVLGVLFFVFLFAVSAPSRYSYGA